MLALSSFLGGTYHGFSAMLDDGTSRSLWQATVLVAVLTSFGLFLAVANQWLEGRALGVCTTLGWVKGAMAVGAVSWWPNFFVVLVDFTFTMVFVLMVCLHYREREWLTAKLMTAGVMCFVVGGFVQQIELAPHPYFNHNDVFHAIQIAGNTLLYLGARRWELLRRPRSL